jgi:4-hydroxy-tetrahydrodipicolinate reductase
LIRVAVAGAAGRMGATTCAAVEAADDLELTGRADPALGTPLESVLDGADVVVDFTRPDAAVPNARACVHAGVHVVIGTTGWQEQDLREAVRGAPANAFAAPNFAIGAVLMMRFAAEAARHMERAEIVELHHATKLDAPSGTALATARLLAASGRFSYNRPEKTALGSARGGEEGGVGVHSIRLPGLVADQEVVFGLPGQTLTIAHRTTSREAFAPGVLLAVRRVVGEPRFYRGLDALLGLA